MRVARQRVPSNLCEHSYAFKVGDDKSIFDAVAVSGFPTFQSL
jgi:hypothetical protein